MIPCRALFLGIGFIGSALPVAAADRALTTGAYAATLGAGGATGAERSAFGQNPASFRPGGMGAHLDFHRPFGLGDLEVCEAGAYLDAVHWGVAVDWRQTGIEALYAEHGFQIAQTFRLGGPGGFPGVLDLGAVWNAWRTEWPGGSRSLDWDHGLGLAWRPFSRLKAGAFVLGLPLDPRAEPGSDRVLQWGLEADSRDPEPAAGRGGGSGRRRGIQILRLDFRKTGNTDWRTLASLTFSPHPALEFTGGFSGPPFQAALGARFSWAGCGLRQSLRYHRFLGRTWLSGLDYSR